MDENNIKFYLPSDEEMVSPLYINLACKKKWESNDQIGFMTVDSYILVYVLAGKGFVIQNSNEIVQLESGSIFIIFPGVRFKLYADSEDPWEVYWISFAGSICDNLLTDIGITHEHYAISILEDNIFHTINSLMEQILDDSTDNFAMLSALMLIFSRIGHLQKSSDKIKNTQKNAVDLVVKFIKQYYSVNLNVDMLCDYVKYSRSYLSRLFNGSMGLTIPEYINQVRIENAKKLFETTTLSVQEVSASVGIDDSFYFSKIFKKLVGISPNQYKKQFAIIKSNI